MIELIEATGAAWANEEKTAIDLVCEFKHIGGPLPFTASADDTESHGREIFERAAAGEFGPVAAFVPVEDPAQ